METNAEILEYKELLKKFNLTEEYYLGNTADSHLMRKTYQ